MAKMKVAQVSRAGGPIELVEREVPQPGAGQVCIRVQACGICHSDMFTIDSQASNPAEELKKLGGARVILATAPSGQAMTALFDGLGTNGKMVVVGASMEPIQVTPIQLIMGRRSLQGWPSGTSMDSEDTLNFAVLSGVRPMIEKFPLERAPEAYERMVSGQAEYRVVLTMSAA